jgi:hypothetical protein
MGHPATKPPTKQEAKQPRDADAERRVNSTSSNSAASRRAKGRWREEVIEPGDAFYMPPGRVPAAVAGTELVMFSPQDELAAVEAAMRELMLHKGNAN